MLENIQAIGKLDDLVGIPGHVAGQVDTPVTVLEDRTVEIEFDTLVVQLTDIHPDGFATGGNRSGGLQDLVDDTLVVEGQVESEAVVEELAFQTEFDFVGRLRTQVVVVQARLDHVVGVDTRLLDTLADIAHGRLVDSRSVTHDTVGSAELGEINPARHIEEFVEDDGTVHGRIPVGVVTGLQRGNGLVTDGSLEISPVVIGEGNRTEDSLLQEL